MIKRRYWAIMFSLGLAFAVMAPISTSGYRSNSAGASAQAARPLKVVLIGDSYSAGNGARNSRGSRSYYGPEDCYRSNDGWAGQYVRWLRTQGHRVYRTHNQPREFLQRVLDGVVDRFVGRAILEFHQPIVPRCGRIAVPKARISNDGMALAHNGL